LSVASGSKTSLSTLVVTLTVPDQASTSTVTVNVEVTPLASVAMGLTYGLFARWMFDSKPGGGTKIGQKVVDERVTIVTDPDDPDTYLAPFTQEGLPTRRVVWIENGVLKNLAYDRFWAQKQNVAPTPAQVGGFGFGGGGGFKMSGGDATLDDLIKGTERGILVTRFWYIRPVDPRTILYTGLTRDGTFLIENGRITKAVKNLRYNESPIFMLNNLEAMTRPVRVSASESGSPGSAIVVPAIRTRDFTFTSLSDAV